MTCANTSSRARTFFNIGSKEVGIAFGLSSPNHPAETGSNCALVIRSADGSTAAAIGTLKQKEIDFDDAWYEKPSVFISGILILYSPTDASGDDDHSSTTLAVCWANPLRTSKSSKGSSFFFIRIVTLLGVYYYNP